LNKEKPKDPFQRVANFFDERVDRYGYDIRAIDYGRKENQTTRFNVLSDITNLKNKRILDVGCGFADYAEYLDERFGSVEYVGIDISQRAIEEAKRLRPRLDLRVCNILDEGFNDMFDVVMANGIYYLLGHEAKSIMRQIIARMYQLSRFGVAFSSLSEWAPSKQPNEFSADPIETLQFCRHVTPWVILRHDYLPHDFTIYMYHEQQSK